MRHAITLLLLAAVVAACGQDEKPQPTAPAAGVAGMKPAADAAAVASLVPTDVAGLRDILRPPRDRNSVTARLRERK